MWMGKIVIDKKTTQMIMGFDWSHLGHIMVFEVSDDDVDPQH